MFQVGSPRFCVWFVSPPSGVFALAGYRVHSCVCSTKEVLADTAAMWRQARGLCALWFVRYEGKVASCSLQHLTEYTRSPSLNTMSHAGRTPTQPLLLNNTGINLLFPRMLTIIFILVVPNNLAKDYLWH